MFSPISNLKLMTFMSFLLVGIVLFRIYDLFNFYSVVNSFYFIFVACYIFFFECYLIFQICSK